MRGMMYAAKIAVASNRVLLMHWNSPSQMTDHLVPATGIDWRIKGTPAENITQFELYKGDNAEDTEFYRWWVTREVGVRETIRQGVYLTNNKRFLVLQSNEFSQAPCKGCPEIKSPDSREAVCLFNYLFKLSDEVETRAQRQLEQLYPDHDLKQGYAAIHLRLGYLKGETVPVERFRGAANDHISGVLRAVSCGLELANKSGIVTNKTPVLLLTDHSSLRHFAQTRKLANVVAPTYGSLHIGTAQQVQSEDHYSTFVDLALMAKAKCILQSKSGFSHMGWLLGGGTDCTVSIHHCMASCTKDPDTDLCLRR